jgi:hypothetical protein
MAVWKLCTFFSLLPILKILVAMATITISRFLEKLSELPPLNLEFS